MYCEKKIAVITDSCADIPREWVERYDIYVLPLIIRSGDKEFHDGVDITSEDVYRMQTDELLHTSTPSGDDIKFLVERIIEKGYKKAVAVMVSGGISGTVNHMRIVADEYADRIEIAVFDSLSGSIGIGATAIMASEYIMDGLSFEEVKERVAKLITQTDVFFSVDTLEHLLKGGRIGKVTALAGGLLNIKPILSLEKEDGEIYAAAKVRGHKAVHKKILQLIDERYVPGRPFNLCVADGGAEHEGDELEAEIKSLYPDFHHYIRVKIGATLSVYIGLGVLGAGIQFLD